MKLDKNDLDKFVAYCEENLGWEVELERNLYASLPLCVVDAVFSINTKYKAVENAMERFGSYFGWTIKRPHKALLPESKQRTVSEFLVLHKKHGAEKMAKYVYVNRQRTSSKNGILKSEAVGMFCEVLKKHGAEYMQNVKKIVEDDEARNCFETDIKAIPGQRSGISTRYFYMLAGYEKYIKPDRMIFRFVNAALGREIRQNQEGMDYCQKLLMQAVKEIAYPKINTASKLDSLIWDYQRNSQR